jgi:hypothetical protein
MNNWFLLLIFSFTLTGYAQKPSGIKNLHPVSRTNISPILEQYMHSPGDEIQEDYQSFDHSEFDYVKAEDYSLNFKYWELPMHANKNNIRQERQRSGLFSSIFKDSFKKQEKKGESPSSPRTYTPKNPHSENYWGSNLLFEVYKTPGGALPEFVVAKLDSKIFHVALASTARAGKSTPSGTFSGFHYKNKWHKSSLYNNAPMPYALFFNGNIAFHGVLEDYYPYLGGIASAGCIRLQVDDALRFWEMVHIPNVRTVTKVYKAGTQPPASELGEIQSRLQENFKQRDYYITHFQSSKYRSPYWPKGYH